jgi:biopolymer transport protein ExbD
MKIAASLRTGRKARIEMLPLIDIVFLLLVFFIYAMLSMAVHRGMPVTLPFSATATVEHQEMVALTVRADGRLFVDRQEVRLEELTPFLADRIGGKTGAPTVAGVRLFGDRHLTFQQLYEVLDRIRQAGVTNIFLQADATDQPL